MRSKQHLSATLENSHTFFLASCSCCAILKKKKLQIGTIFAIPYTLKYISAFQSKAVHNFFFKTTAQRKKTNLPKTEPLFSNLIHRGFILFIYLFLCQALDDKRCKMKLPISFKANLHHEMLNVLSSQKHKKDLFCPVSHFSLHSKDSKLPRTQVSQVSGLKCLNLLAQKSASLFPQS